MAIQRALNTATLRNANYEARFERLEITFASGEIRVFKGVPEEVARRFFLPHPIRPATTRTGLSKSMRTSVAGSAPMKTPARSWTTFFPDCAPATDCATGLT